MIGTFDGELHRRINIQKLWMIQSNRRYLDEKPVDFVRFLMESSLI